MSPSSPEEGVQRPGGSGGGAPLLRWEGHEVEWWRRELEIPLLEVHSSLGSTNDRARRLAMGEAAPFTVVVAEEQTDGRGRGAKRWHSPARCGLWFSLLVRTARGGNLSLVPLLTGVALARAVEWLRPTPPPGIKWPNDLLVDGRKVAGVLCEGAGEMVVVGVGVNLRPPAGGFPTELVGGAGWLGERGGEEVPPGELLRVLVPILRSLLDPPPTQISPELLRELSSRDVLLGAPLQVDDGPPVIGRGLDRDGALLVEAPSGSVRRVVAGTVRVVGDSPPVPGGGGP